MFNHNTLIFIETWRTATFTVSSSHDTNTEQRNTSPGKNSTQTVREQKRPQWPTMRSWTNTVLCPALQFNCWYWSNMKQHEGRRLVGKVFARSSWCHCSFRREPSICSRNIYISFILRPRGIFSVTFTATGVRHLFINVEQDNSHTRQHVI